jgi:hypothetical protein
MAIDYVGGITGSVAEFLRAHLHGAMDRSLIIAVVVWPSQLMA